MLTKNLLTYSIKTQRLLTRTTLFLRMTQFTRMGRILSYYDAIKEQISHASVVLILAGVYSSYSKWIDKEITIAQTEFNSPKKIIAIEPWGAQKTSTKVKNAADSIVGWNSKSVIDAIKNLS